MSQMFLSKVVVMLTAMLSCLALAPAQAQQAASPSEARAIAKEAYIYGFPLVDNYRIQYAYVVDSTGPEFKAPWNCLRSIARVYSPEDKTIQTPNSDTPYSLIGMDLRAEPIVLTVPPIETDRYFSIQLVDAYTHNFDYIGSRTTGNDGGSYLVAGPRWRGTAPQGIKKVIRAETELVSAVYRTQLFAPADIENVKRIQEAYKAQPLSAFLGQPAPVSAPSIEFMKPLTPAEQRTSPEFFNVLNFALQFCPTHPSEKALMDRFAKIGIGAGLTFDVGKLTPEMRSAIEAGMADAWAELRSVQQRIDAKEVTSGELFGTREFLKNNYIFRMAGTVLGIYGNSKLEAVYPIYSVDGDGKKLDGANRYRIHFAPDQLPPVNAFWSLTLYELPSSLLYANSLNRYLLNSPMMPQLQRGKDGGLTLLIQHESPGTEMESNWLPAPKGPFFIAMRLYWPKPQALDGTWTAPSLERVP